MTSSLPPGLRLGYVPGATPAKWARIWGERHPDVRLVLVPLPAADAPEAVRDGTVDLALLRLPAETSGLATIALYEEQVVAVVPKEHHAAAADDLAAADLDEEPTLLPHDDALHWGGAPGAPVEHRPESTEAAIELVAAGLGVLLVPQSLARLHHRKDLTYRPVTDAPPSPVVLAVLAGEQPEAVAEFIGVVRGRKAGSSRGLAEPAPKRTAREKTRAKQAARAAAGKKAATPKAKPGKRPRR
ncbi:LysR family transcriptional regulator substrate-binding protein [Tsukamurella ocularis]|uniref:LysR family transcriptional regulator substrate-binding protein n=1 Tax=Tsukamurella ocularis TaxID=1970234 RepID=UPI002168B212|nr:LysR family transcriptional regulator substrate-binding protein [Tsukamurella ocularis]MCS3780108.1 DNA-binding transcriptional LysR family regulator [Tsukamurella ocularis]MCS3786338.1 DNA-binding transcriptional LysR family regulator [Tsukamurella ocularis]MCS3849702.1 DNA-binding transcriptional LysR family regulator [Tsukamurella ocularis]